MAVPSIRDVDVRGKRVLVRADLNLPGQDGVITDRTRLERVLPTIKGLSERAPKSSSYLILVAPKASPSSGCHLHRSPKP